jgi:hypothetical protein
MMQLAGIQKKTTPNLEKDVIKSLEKEGVTPHPSWVAKRIQSRQLHIEWTGTRIVFKN